MAELTDAEIADIRRRYEVGLVVLLRRLSASYGVGADCIEAIVHGRPWRHLAERNEPAIRGLFDDPRR